MSLDAPPVAAREQALKQAFARLEELRLFTGPPGQFWPAFLQIALGLAPGAEAVLLTRNSASDEAGLWKDSFCWPPNTPLPAALKAAKAEFERFAQEVETNGVSTAARGRLIAVRLARTADEQTAIVVIAVTANADVAEAITRLRLLVDVPLLYARARAVEQARHEQSRFAGILDLSVLLNAQTRFIGAAMHLCNELAVRHRCERVSLGWLEHGYTRLQAISHTEKFERKMAIAVALEQAMDEALDQDEEILWPPPSESGAVCRDHEAFARTYSAGQLLSVPIRIDTAPVGVLTLERAAAEEFTTDELQTLRLLCDHIARRLHDLKRHDRWFGARLATWIREKGSTLVGPEHTVRKLLCIGIAALVAVLAFGSADYRVEAPFILKSDALAHVPAPFDGYLYEVQFRVGDAVRKGQPLLSLDTRELLLQEAAALAERQRFLSEAHKAEGDNDVAAMQIAQASAAEAQARLDLATHHLAQARVLAPFDGFVVEGDLRERLSAPVKQGEVLAKVARIDTIYAEVAMPERDVHEIAAGQAGEIAFASRPQWSFPLRIERVVPAAEVREQGNIFVLRGEFSATPQSWWRPGMSGVCKVDVGRRNLFWIFTHRTVDFLRLKLWW